MSDTLTPEEEVIREWVEAMTTASGSPLPPSQRRAEPLPRRRVLPVIVTLLDIIDGLRASRSRLAAQPTPTLDADHGETRLYMSAEEIEAALKRLRGPVTRDEATVMAAAQAAADALRGSRIAAARLSNVTAPEPSPDA